MWCGVITSNTAVSQTVINIPADTGKVTYVPDSLWLTPGDKFPNIVFRVEPKYPKEALRKGIEGVVSYQVQIDTFGNVKNIMITSKTPDILNQAVINAVSQWKFEQARSDGFAVEGWIMPRPFHFKLPPEYKKKKNK
jgi:TonB family protein